MIAVAAVAVDGSAAQVDTVAKAPLGPAVERPPVEQRFAPKPLPSGTGLTWLRQQQCVNPSHQGWPAEDLTAMVRSMQPSLSPEQVRGLIVESEHNQLYEDALHDLQNQGLDVPGITRVTTVCLMHAADDAPTTGWSISFPAPKIEPAYRER